MNVLVVASKYPPEYSGSGRRLHDLYTRLKRGDTSIHWKVLSTRGGEALPGHYEGVPVWRVPGARSVPQVLPTGVLKFAEVLYGMRELMASLAHLNRGALPDTELVHTCGWSWCVIGACLWAHRRRIPVIRELTSMHDHPFSPSWMRPIIRATLQRADLIVAISPYLAEKCARAGLGGRVWCRPNPVDESRFHPVSREESLHLRRRLFPEFGSGEGILLLNVGRIRPLKNQLALLEVLAHLPSSYRLVLAGPASSAHDPYLEGIIRRAESPELRGRVLLKIGDHRTPEEFMQAADLFLFPSTSEGLGSVVLEALMCGLPVVVQPLRGITDTVVEHGRNGFLVPFQNSRAAEAVLGASVFLGHGERIAAEARDRFGARAIDEAYCRHIGGLVHR